MQELEPDEDGGDLIVEIADGIHVRVARKALATVVKPDDEEDEGEAGEAGEAGEEDEADVAGGEAELVAADAEPGRGRRG